MVAYRQARFGNLNRYKLAKWQAVAKRVPAVSKQVQVRAQVWQTFIQERNRQAELQRQQAEREHLAKAVALKKLRGLKAEDEALERKRTAQMEKDWAKLSKLIKLRVVSAEDKLNWVEAFVEAYGAVPALNPHIGALAQWTAKMNRFDDLEEEGQREAKRRAQRSAEIASKMDEVTTGIKFIQIPAGTFDMGSNNGDSDEKPVHRVDVKAFLMSETEVTVGQYRQCVEAGRCSKPKTSRGCTWGGSDDHPINCVDWGQARTFAVWAAGDLPTEAQWEYAARGGENYKYAGSNDEDEVAWYRSNSRKSTHPVKAKKSNGYGLYDMSGNVLEWILDKYHSDYDGAPSRAEKPWSNVGKCSRKCDNGSSRRVFRGGSWYGDATFLRVAVRINSGPEFLVNSLGFRVRRTLP
jgi:formylglycine-generating enzyme required for sulfatase activity